jgi:hypothetical protein
LVTLSGAGRRGILYMDTCDPAQVFTTSHCQDQATPRLVVENLAFADRNSSGEDFDGGGGGAIFARGGRLRIVHSTFVGNRCDRDGPDVGGGAVRVLSEYCCRARTAACRLLIRLRKVPGLSRPPHRQPRLAGTLAGRSRTGAEARAACGLNSRQHG